MSQWILLVGVMIGATPDVEQMDPKTERLIADLRSGGGSIVFDEIDSETGKPIVHVTFQGQLTQDQHLRLCKPIKTLAKLDIVDCPNLTEEAYETLTSFKLLRHVVLSGCSNTDTALEKLRPMAGLKCLELQKSDVTDAGLKHLKSLKKLRAVNLKETIVSSAGLYELKSLKLQALNLSGCPQITDESLKSISDQRQLVYLNLSNLNMTTAGLVEIKLRDFKQITALDLSRTTVSDEVLKEVRLLKNLDFLDLSGTKITENGLKELKGLTKLSFLNLTRCTAILEPDVANLQQSLKRTQIAF
ncbi:MAG: hypothetical protein FJ267_10880 [Planctomycetes bacterium]|nr:hypothetical protein [Planctomycetota bacterium]